MEDSQTEQRVPAAAAFTATRWSVVLAAGGVTEKSTEAALEWLCERYWFPLFAHVRGRGHSPHDAEDLVQGFFASLLSQNLVGRADAERGRFRSFLLGCLNNFMAHEWEKGNRLKRGGGARIVSLEEFGAEAEIWLQRELTSARTPALDYDRAWALALVERALRTLRAEYREDGSSRRFEVLECFLHGGRGEVPLAEAAARLDLSLAAVKSIVHRMRMRFRAILFAEVRETVRCDDDVREELQRLLEAVA